MSRRGSERKRARVQIEILVRSELKYPEIRKKLESALADPTSAISRYLHGEISYFASDLRCDVSVVCPDTTNRWAGVSSGDPEDPIDLADAIAEAKGRE